MISQLEAQKSTRPGADGDARERLLAAMPVRERWLQLAGISTAVLEPDLPGHGASGVGDAPVDVERISAWLGELIERTCASPPVVVGHWLGGGAGRRAER